jgi:hypothetical protein
MGAATWLIGVVRLHGFDRDGVRQVMWRNVADFVCSTRMVRCCLGQFG